MIYYDLDGVIRDLSQAIFGAQPPSWGYQVDGKGIVELIEKDLTVLLNAPPTEYLECLKDRHVVFLSAQLPTWRNPTRDWLWEHVKPVAKLYALACVMPEEKLSFLKKNDVLIEDSPRLKDYSKVILVDRPYNKGIKCKKRIHNVEEFYEIIEKYAV